MRGEVMPVDMRSEELQDLSGGISQLDAENRRLVAENAHLREAVRAYCVAYMLSSADEATARHRAIDGAHDGLIDAWIFDAPRDLIADERER